MERRLIADYEATIDLLLSTLDQNNHAMAVQIAGCPRRCAASATSRRRT